MFSPYRVFEGVQQKRRAFRLRVWRVRREDLGWWRVRLITLGPGCFAPGTLTRYFIWAKRACRGFRLQRRFWFNLQQAHIVTRKPLNMRMGKGKGERVGIYATVQAGAVVVAFSSIRFGALRLLQHRYQARTAIPLARSIPRKHAGGFPNTCFVGTLALGGFSSHQLQRHWLRDQLADIEPYLKQLDIPWLMSYWRRLVCWRFVLPRAQWCPSSEERWYWRGRRLVGRRRRLLWASRPQGLGFLRQLKWEVLARPEGQRLRRMPTVWAVCKYWWQQGFEILNWPYLTRWSNAEVLALEGPLRALPHLAHTLLLQPELTETVRGLAPYAVDRLCWHYAADVRFPYPTWGATETRAEGLAALVQLQLVGLLFIAHWQGLIGRQLTCSWVFSRTKAILEYRAALAWVAEQKRR